MKLDGLGLTEIERRIQLRAKRITEDYEIMQELKQKRDEIIKRKLERKTVIDWDFNKIKKMKDMGMRNCEIIKVLGVNKNSFNSYLYRMREEGKDI